MRTRILLSTLVLGVLAALLGSAAVAVFTDTQYTTGEVTSATAATLSLHICEPIGGHDETGDPACPGDDNLDDEIIFENVEGLATGFADHAHWDVRLRNAGDVLWDLHEVHYTATETADPGADCAVLPEVHVTVLGQSFYEQSSKEVNDNHKYGDNPDNLNGSRLYNDMTGWNHAINGQTFYKSDAFRVHVAPGDYEDMRVKIWLSEEAGDECQGNAWDISLSWTVVEH